MAQNYQNPEISAEELSQDLAADEAKRPLLLDVRNPEEHVFVALPGSTLIPMGELQARTKELEGQREKEIVVYCHSGMRSMRAATYLRSLGFKARSLAGGIDRYATAVDPSLKRY